MNKEEIVKKFGFDPEEVGLRHRSYWIIEELDEDDKAIGANVGDLCIRARDGGDNPQDYSAEEYGDYIGSSEGWDITYRYYYYRPIKT